jgi:hypothetical protein
MMDIPLFAFGGVLLVCAIGGYLAWVANSLPPEKPRREK